MQGDNNPVPQFCTLRYEKNQYVCISFTEDNEAMIILQKIKQLATHWKTNELNNQLSLQFLIDNKPVYLSYLKDKLCLHHQPYYFDFSILSLPNDQILILAVDHCVKVSYSIEPANKQTNFFIYYPTPQTANPTSETAKTIGRIIVGISNEAGMVLSGSQALVKVMRMAASFVRNVLSKMSRLLRNGASYQEIDDIGVSSIRTYATESQAQAQFAEMQASTLAAKRAAAEAARAATEKAEGTINKGQGVEPSAEEEGGAAKAADTVKEAAEKAAKEAKEAAEKAAKEAKEAAEKAVKEAKEAGEKAAEAAKEAAKDAADKAEAAAQAAGKAIKQQAAAAGQATQLTEAIANTIISILTL